MGTPYFITDHAVLRYMARVKGIDVEAYRSELLRECLPALEAGATMVRTKECTYIFRNRRLTTVYDNSMGKRKPKSKSFAWPSHMRAEMEAERKSKL